MDRGQEGYRSSPNVLSLTVLASGRDVCRGLCSQEVACCYLENHWKIQLLRGPSVSVQMDAHSEKPHRANHSNVGIVIFKCLFHNIKRNIFSGVLKIKS